jgi:hypothetical protein
MAFFLFPGRIGCRPAFSDFLTGFSFSAGRTLTISRFSELPEDSVNDAM